MPEIDWENRLDEIPDTQVRKRICIRCTDGEHEFCREDKIYDKEQLKWSGCNQKSCECDCRGKVSE